MRDDELHRLFVEELRKHRVTLADPDAALEAKRRALHALKGAAGLIGEPVLADTIARLERRIREGDLTALPSAEKILEGAEQALARGPR